MKPITKVKCCAGTRFGKLLIIKSWSKEFDNGRKHIVCDCVCDCGGTITVRASALLYDNKRQCGCEDGRGSRSLCKVGAKYGKLTILRVWSDKFANHSKERVCECICECGQTVVVRAKNIRNSHKLSCGCLTRRTSSDNPLWKGHGEISKSFWNGIKGASLRRSRTILFDITIEQVWELFLKQDRKCALSGVSLVFPPKSRYYGDSGTASLDRIDSSKGYTIDNIQWVHKNINLMKWHLPQETFLEWCRMIAEYQNPN